ncbi:MAG: hypothetical protein KGI08_07535 [Thaumarchaeota archaeon]|nr:hypothetical protein [Nitrososphaerota archaeon]
MLPLLFTYCVGGEVEVSRYKLPGIPFVPVGAPVPVKTEEAGNTGIW